MRRLPAVCWAALAAALWSCTRGAAPREPTAPAAASRGDPALARVGDVDILRSDVAIQMRATHQTERQALDQLIRFELLARAAAASISPSDPDVRAATDAMLVQRLIERDLEPHLTKADIPDDVLRGVYERAQKVFVHPRLVEVAMLNVYTGARMKPEPRAKAAAVARALDAQLRRSPRHTVDEFESIALDPAWKERKVQYSRVWQAIDDPFPAAVGREVQRLRQPGDITPLITADTGFHVALYIDERPPENISFADARDRLRDQIYERWRTARFLEFAQAAAGAHSIEAYPEHLTGQ
ncbi:MAG TPA: peptidyl-prolyl cis-trans isomerase [Polyangia bacterium]|nr:peptidyl-prolyl cis-trans isomerase [Polyangia bacterium]